VGGGLCRLQRGEVFDKGVVCDRVGVYGGAAVQYSGEGVGAGREAGGEVDGADRIESVIVFAFARAVRSYTAEIAA
jgi:hypothetical protein